jgi:hypothetical protein
MPRHVDPGKQFHRQSENCYAGQWTMDNAVLLAFKNIQSAFSNWMLSKDFPGGLMGPFLYVT